MNAKKFLCTEKDKATMDQRKPFLVAKNTGALFLIPRGIPS
jgi:hypothetical protein